MGKKILPGDFLPGKPHAIVGIDPGATFGIAIIDLFGKKAALHSTAGGFSEAVRLIEAHCTPSLVACDTNPAPEAALRLASYFSCRLSSPRESIREGEKNAIARSAGAADAHKRDAFCAAVYAYRSHANKLRQIDALDGLSGEERGRVKHLLLRGMRVQDAFLLLREPGEPQGRQAKGWHEPAAKKASTADELRMRLESLARENANLRMANERLEAEKSSLLQRLHLLENGVRQSLFRDSEFRRLRHRLDQSLSRLRQKGGKRQVHAGQLAKQKAHAMAKKADGEGAARHGGQSFARTGAKTGRM